MLLCNGDVPEQISITVNTRTLSGTRHGYLVTPSHLDTQKFPGQGLDTISINISEVHFSHNILRRILTISKEYSRMHRGKGTISFYEDLNNYKTAFQNYRFCTSSKSMLFPFDPVSSTFSTLLAILMNQPAHVVYFTLLHSSTIISKREKGQNLKICFTLINKGL